MGKSSTGLDENIAGLLCYVATWVTGIIFFVIEKDSKFVKFHAMQSIVAFGGIAVIMIIISILGTIFAFISASLGWIFSAINGLLGLLIFILWIICMIKAYQHQTFKLPIAGDIAEKQLK